MSDRDKGAAQHADSNGNKLDKGAVEKNVPAVGGMLFRHPGMTGRMQDLVGGMKG